MAKRGRNFNAPPQIEAVGPWQIKDFPQALRLEVVEQARRERLSVGDFLARHITAIRDTGWRPAGGSPHLRQTVEVACLVADHSKTMPKDVADLAYDVIKDTLRKITKV